MMYNDTICTVAMVTHTDDFLEVSGEISVDERRFADRSISKDHNFQVPVIEIRLYVPTRSLRLCVCVKFKS